MPQWILYLTKTGFSEAVWKNIAKSQSLRVRESITILAMKDFDLVEVVSL